MTEINHTDSKDKTVTEQSYSTSRRGFLVKSAIAAPIITSVASMPVWGTGSGYSMGSISGNLSGNLSNHVHNTPTYDGFSPGYYMSHSYKPNGNSPQHHNDPLKLDPDDAGVINQISNDEHYTYVTTLAEVFPASGLSSNTIQQVLTLNQVNTEKFERVLLCAALNSLYKPGFPYALEELRLFAIAVEGNGTYCQATNILNQLIHNGQDSDSSDSSDDNLSPEVCS